MTQSHKKASPQTQTRLQLHTRNNKLHRNILPKQDTDNTHTTRTVTSPSHHSWHPTRQHPLHHLLPDLHQRHHQNSANIEGIHIRRRHNPYHLSNNKPRPANSRELRTLLPHHLLPQKQPRPERYQNCLLLLLPTLTISHPYQQQPPRTDR